MLGGSPCIILLDLVDWYNTLREDSAAVVMPIRHDNVIIIIITIIIDVSRPLY